MVTGGRRGTFERVGTDMLAGVYCCWCCAVLLLCCCPATKYDQADNQVDSTRWQGSSSENLMLRDLRKFVETAKVQ